MGIFNKKEDLSKVGTSELQNPESLAYFYMDNLMCHEYYINH